jgi:hypothetical protein
VLVIYRWLFLQPRVRLRLASRSLDAAERRGIDPRKGIVVVAEDQGWRPWGASLMKRQPFTADEVATLAAKVATQPAQRFVYVPSVFPEPMQQPFAQRFLAEPAVLAPARLAYASLLGAPDAHARQRFIESYRYDVSPVTDERPFFFEYERVHLLPTLVASLNTIRGAAVYQSLLVLLLFTVGISAVGTLVPLSLLARKGLSVPRAGTLACFFSCLGLGYMLIEIGLMQRLSLFLGDPVRSITVVLSGLLLFTGIGSALAGYVHAGARLVRSAAIVVAALACLAPLLLPRVLDGAFTWSLFVRIGLVLVLLLPLSITMGTPFATGLRQLDARAPLFIPWAWGINGLSSVAGSVIAIVVAMQFGFDSALLLGALCYAGAAVTTRALRE